MAIYLNRVTKEWYDPPVDTGDCGPGFIRNPDLSLVSGIHQSRWVIDGDVVRAPTEQETAQFDAAELAMAKESRISEIDAKTASLIESGSVTVNGINVSTSLPAQVSLNALEGLVRLGVATWPQDVSATNGGKCTISSQPDFVRIAGIVATNVATTKALGRYLRSQVLACTTIEQVQAVEDNR